MELYLRKESNLECRVRELINQITQSKYISPIDVKMQLQYLLGIKVVKKDF